MKAIYNLNKRHICKVVGEDGTWCTLTAVQIAVDKYGDSKCLCNKHKLTEESK